MLAALHLGTVVAERPVSISPILAHVIAHELSHLLLPPNSHAPFGVMRRAWSWTTRRFVDSPANNRV